MNYDSLLAKLRFDFPGLGHIPKAPDPYPHRRLVDIHVAKWERHLVKRIPKVEIDRNHPRLPETQNQTPRGFLSDLISEGYLVVVEELNSLTEQEEKLICKGKGIEARKQTFLSNKLIMDELIVGLKRCADEESLGDIYKSLLLRKQLSEKIIALGDNWLAKKILDHILTCLSKEEINDETDRLRVEVWCLLSYLYIYFEDSSLEFGYNLPLKYLMLARNLSNKKSWYMNKPPIDILVPKPINVYGLRNDWKRIRVDYCSLYKIATTLLHVLFVKKARYWQDELIKHPHHQHTLSENFSNDLNSALTYADEARRYESFVATTLRRGLFFEELGKPEKAMEDYDTVLALTRNFEDQESLAMVINRYGQDNKRDKKVMPALDYFAQQWEIASENEYLELKAESLKDLGHLLLEEGDLWQADECISHSYSLFRESKRKDTPNDLADVSWAMNGVTRGMHLWGRFSGLLRTDHLNNIHHVAKWKNNRTPLPVVTHSPFRPHKRFRYDQQYSLESENRRFFEFNKVLVSKLSSLVTEQDMIELFAFINNSRLSKLGDGHVQYRDSEDDEYQTLSAQRAAEAKSRAESMAFSLKRTTMMVQSRLDERMSQDVIHDYQRNIWSRRHKHLHSLNIFNDPTTPLEIKLQALLQTMDEFATKDLYVQAVPIKERPTQAFAGNYSNSTPKVKSKMPPELLEEFRNFDASEWKL